MFRPVGSALETSVLLVAIFVGVTGANEVNETRWKRHCGRPNLEHIHGIPPIYAPTLVAATQVMPSTGSLITMLEETTAQTEKQVFLL